MQKQMISVAALLAAVVVSTGCEVRERSYGDRPYRHRDVVAVQVAPLPPPPPSAYVVQAPPPPAVVVQAPPPPAPPPPPASPVVLQAAPPVADQVVVVQTAPPPPRFERRPHAPGRDFVWLSGYWAVQRGAWVWVSGHWERPPHPGAVWVPHHWDPAGPNFHFSAGYWR